VAKKNITRSHPRVFDELTMFRKAPTILQRNQHLTTIAVLLISGYLGFAFANLAPRAYAASAPSEVWASEAALAALPEGPEKALVLEHCAVCHALDRIVASGGTKEGWTDRINRMFRWGATIPRDQVPAVATYLAQALPPRPQPPENTSP